MKPAKLKLVTGKVVVMEIDHKATGKLAREARIERGWTLAEVARAMGVSGPYIHDLERGQRNWNQFRADGYSRALNDCTKWSELLNKDAEEKGEG